MKTTKTKILITAAALSLTGNAIAQSLPWFNENYAIEERVDMLVSAMTLEEKVSQMIDNASAIDRLGIPRYHWWNECLHGVARAGVATVYPQAIALAATFDDEAMFRSATIISDEARAKHHDAIRKGERGKDQGLTFWSPNINIFRDPRWGRGQETYGEDPYLTGRMGVAFVKGLQGDNPDFYKLVATAKHYAVHSGPEYQRHVFDAWPSDFDLWDTYLPAFRTLVKEAGVLSVMCAYNRFEGYPCCGSDKLQHRILRELWGFDGYIVSDCGAITDFYKTHHYSRDAASASAAGVRAGTDLECGPSYRALVDAVNSGQISEEELDVSLKRLFYARFKLGMFSPDDKNPYAQIPYSVVDCNAHKQDALEMARKSIVLLKNESNTLPLKKSLKKIAVIGPAANDSISLLGNYNGMPSHRKTILEGICQKVGKRTEIIYKQGVNFLDDEVFEPVDFSTLISSDDKPGMKAEYFQNIALAGQPVYSRVETKINFEGYEVDEIAPGVKASQISVRWRGDFMPNETKDYTFRVSGDDGYRLLIDDKPIIDEWRTQGEKTVEAVFKAEQGRRYSIRLEYFQAAQGATIRFFCGETSKTDFDRLATEVSDADAIIFAGGISPLLEGEEMRVDLPGFYRGDRTTIALPKVQTEMMKALKSTGKPVIFIMQTGSALGIPWEDENLAAILNVWYGGQAIGTAVADILFGDYNPAGRLPVTFYKSDDDLPAYFNYSMRGRTYRYFDGEPLYPFGYGLSYSNFSYSELKAPKRLATGMEFEISVKVTNNSARDGDEVVQLYVIHPYNDAEANPICALKGFKRVALKASESKVVQMSLKPEDMALVNSAGDLVQDAAVMTIYVGGGQPNFTENGITAQVTLRGQPANLGK